MSERKEGINVKNLSTRDSECYIIHKIPDMCPRCHNGITPDFIGGAYYPSGDDEVNLSVLYHCPSCKSCFLTTHNELGANILHLSFGLEVLGDGVSEPTSFVGNEFPDGISNLSPQCVEIYHQSENAEAIGLNQISGMGYRKALEFLVKDYAIHKNSDQKSEIEKAFLSTCIKKYIENPKIQTLAEKSAWLGNDETHYVKEHTDRDVSDLKKFIKACANHIETELTVEDAETV